MPCGKLEDRLDVVLIRHFFPIGDLFQKIDFREKVFVRSPLFGRQSVPFERLRVIFAYAVAVLIESSKFDLGVHKTMFGGRAAPFECFRMIRSRPFAVFITAGKFILCRRIALPGGF